MPCRFLVLFSWLAVTLAGCAKTEQPAPESIPKIPPGRAAAAPASGNSTDQPTTGEVPPPPRRPPR